MELVVTKLHKHLQTFIDSSRFDKVLKKMCILALGFVSSLRLFGG